MKRIIMMIISLLLISSQFSYVCAYEDELKEYTDAIEGINKEYNTSFYLLTEADFYKYDYNQLFNKDYEKYIQDIKNTDLESFRNELLQLAIESNGEIIEVYINEMTRSMLGTRTVLFFSGHNTMTLRCKYSGSTFDTSYKPTVTVNKVHNFTYFEMSSHTGKFTNSNKTYSVTAKGRVITETGIVGNQSFTVNFNL